MCYNCQIFRLSERYTMTKDELPMRGSRDRWRSVAMTLADELYKRSPHLPDLDAFYQLLNDPYDGDGVNGN